MALKDTIDALRKRQDEAARAEQNKPALIKEWQAAVHELLTWMHKELASYERDGSMVVEILGRQLNEDYLGSYSTEAMAIKIGPIIVNVEPIARMIVGGLGRVDMHRQGRAADSQRIMFLRAGRERQDEALPWNVRFPNFASPGQRIIRGMQHRIEPLTKETFETALELLLK